MVRSAQRTGGVTTVALRVGARRFCCVALCFSPALFCLRVVVVSGSIAPAGVCCDGAAVAVRRKPATGALPPPSQRGYRGAVSSEHFLATEAGLAALREGGNAIDAAAVVQVGRVTRAHPCCVRAHSTLCLRLPISFVTFCLSLSLSLSVSLCTYISRCLSRGVQFMLNVVQPQRSVQRSVVQCVVMCSLRCGRRGRSTGIGGGTMFLLWYVMLHMLSHVGVARVAASLALRCARSGTRLRTLRTRWTVARRLPRASTSRRSAQTTAARAPSTSSPSASPAVCARRSIARVVSL